MRNWLIKLLGGYTEEITRVETKECTLLHGVYALNEFFDQINRYKNIDEKHLILTEAVKHLFNGIGADDILKRNQSGSLVFGDRQLTKAEEEELRDEAFRLLNSKLWKVLRNDISYQLNKKMFEEANDQTGMMWGKVMVWYDNIIKTRLESLVGKKD